MKKQNSLIQYFYAKTTNTVAIHYNNDVKDTDINLDTEVNYNVEIVYCIVFCTLKN